MENTGRNVSTLLTRRIHMYLKHLEESDPHTHADKQWLAGFYHHTSSNSTVLGRESWLVSTQAGDTQVQLLEVLSV